MKLDYDDYLQDIAFNYYGDKCALCNINNIKIYKKINKKKSFQSNNNIQNIINEINKFNNNNNIINNNNNFDNEWEKTYDDDSPFPILKIEWAYPDNDDILAAISFKSVLIFKVIEEIIDNKSKTILYPLQEITDNNDIITDISFCPKNGGTIFAYVTLNGIIKIYDSLDYKWEIKFNKKISNFGCSCICWNPSDFDPESLIVGCKMAKNENNNNNDDINIDNNNNNISNNNLDNKNNKNIKNKKNNDNFDNKINKNKKNNKINNDNNDNKNNNNDNINNKNNKNNNNNNDINDNNDNKNNKNNKNEKNNKNNKNDKNNNNINKIDNNNKNNKINKKNKIENKNNNKIDNNNNENNNNKIDNKNNNNDNKNNDNNNKETNKIDNNNNINNKLENNKLENNNNNNCLLKIFLFEKIKKNSEIIIDITNEHSDDITDVKWCNQNGRDYHLIASISLDMKLIIWKINIDYIKNFNLDEYYDIKIKYEKIYEYKNSFNQPLEKCCFNEIGNLLSCIDKKGNVFVFFKTGKTEFKKIDIK